MRAYSVIIMGHELEAMYDLVLQVRAVVSVLGDAKGGSSLVASLKNRAQMIEDIIDRVELEELEGG